MAHEIHSGRVEEYVVTYDGITAERGINYRRIHHAAQYEHISESLMLAIAEASTEDLSLDDIVDAVAETEVRTEA